MKVTLDFHKSSEERPEKSCRVIVMDRGQDFASVYCVNYSKKYDLFNAHDDCADELKYGFNCNWWAYIPEECYKGGEKE